MLIRLLPFLASAALLGGLTAERLSLLPPKSSVEYHRRVKSIAAQLPLQFGPWIGEDVPVEAAATRMLNANVLISRHYRNLSTGLEVGYLFVQGKDARALMDHYPPICYVMQGYVKDAARATDWTIGDLHIRGTEYEFSRQDSTDVTARVIDNFIVMPSGEIERDMEATKIAASDLQKRFFGAAQFQLGFNRGVSREERDEALRAFVGTSQPLIQAVQSGFLH